MIDFTPTDEQQMLVDAIKRYAVNDLQPNAHEMDEQSDVRDDLVQKGWELGLLPASIPEDLGGFGEYSSLTNVLALEELAFGDLSTTLKLITPSLLAFPVLHEGTDKQKEQFLPLFADEKPYPATAALIEPRINFDPFDLQTTATHDGDSVVLNGIKAYVPNAAEAEWILVYAKDSQTGNIGGYLIETSAVEGLVIEDREKLMGIRGLATHHIKLNDVHISKEAVLGGEQGINFQNLVNHMNLGVAAVGTGVMRASYEYALDYAKERVQFGKPIATKQAVAFMLAECAIEVDSSRLMTWEAAWQLEDNKTEATQACYLAREYANKTGLFVTDSGVQVLGGHGFIREHPVERWLRNARGLPMFSGLVYA